MLICLELKNDPLGVNLGNNLCAVVIKAKPLHLPLREFLSAITSYIFGIANMNVAH